MDTENDSQLREEMQRRIEECRFPFGELLQTADGGHEPTTDEYYSISEYIKFLLVLIKEQSFSLSAPQKVLAKFRKKYIDGYVVNEFSYPEDYEQFLQYKEYSRREHPDFWFRLMGLLIDDPDSIIRKHHLRFLVAEKYDSRLADISRITGRQSGYFSRLLSLTNKYDLKFGRKLASDFEAKLGLPPGWFETINPDDPDNRPTEMTLEPLSTDKAREEFNNVIKQDHIEVNVVPVISSVQAGNWSEAYDPYPPGDGDTWLPCPVPTGPHSFALKVTGVSMQPDFMDGELVFVDPDRAAENGDFVVAKLTDSNEVTLKKYIREDGQNLLMATNPEWEPKYLRLDQDSTIIGVAIFKGFIL